MRDEPPPAPNPDEPLEDDGDDLPDTHPGDLPEARAARAGGRVTG